MSHVEMPLVLFSVLSQTAIGLSIMNSCKQWATESPGEDGRRQWGIILVFLITGMVASFFHLGHPLQAYTALKHLSTAWLSWELLGISIFLCLSILGFFMARDNNGKLLGFAAALVGVFTLLFMGMTYSPPGYPAINNVLPMVFFLLSALLLGTSCSSWFAPPASKLWLTRILSVTLFIALTVYLLVPCIWLSGGTVTAETGWAWLNSPLYWGHIGIGLLLPLVLLRWTKVIPPWLPLLILVGELMGRASFFKDTLHAAGNLGGIY